MAITWDYKVLEVYNEVKFTTVNWIYEEDGKKLSLPSGSTLTKLKELGEQGWELVSSSVYGAPLHYVYWLKRPR